MDGLPAPGKAVRRLSWTRPRKDVDLVPSAALMPSERREAGDGRPGPVVMPQVPAAVRRALAAPLTSLDRRDGGGVRRPETVAVLRAPAAPSTFVDRRGGGGGGGRDRPDTAAVLRAPAAGEPPGGGEPDGRASGAGEGRPTAVLGGADCWELVPSERREAGDGRSGPAVVRRVPAAGEPPGWGEPDGRGPGAGGGRPAAGRLGPRRVVGAGAVGVDAVRAAGGWRWPARPGGRATGTGGRAASTASAGGQGRDRAEAARHSDGVRASASWNPRGGRGESSSVFVILRGRCRGVSCLVPGLIGRERRGCAA